MLKRAIHVGAAAIAVVAVIAGAGACGAPEFTYVKNSGQKTYFKIPHDWHKIGTSDLDNAIGGTTPGSESSERRKQAWWTVAFDASSDPSPAHLLTSDVTDQPIVYARVSAATVALQGALSLDLLRNSFLPVTADAREAADSTTQLTGFEWLTDEVLTPSSGMHGVREIYNYELDGVPHTFDLTALTNNDSSKLYLLLIRCSATCYRDRSGELDTIAKSFTVRSN